MIEAKEIENGRDDVYVDRKYAEATHLPLDEKELARIYRKVDRRVLPLLAVLYLLCFLDRSNIGNAKVLNADTDDDLMHELGMSESQYRIAMMVFIVGYSVFEAPSNMVMKVLNPPL
ncbi:hypothetical protein LTS12_029104 [Elasticomyces elasticus]|nr:hypothetical protein LTS12_029104 [Elasticomyces elasticus]